MFLATTALEEFWSPDEDTLYLGPWCFRDEDDMRGKRLSRCPWDDRENLHRAVLECRESHEYLLARLAESLNASLGVSRSVRSWNILLGIWLMRHLHQVYDRLLHVRLAMAEDSGLHTLYLHERNFRIPRDVPHFNELFSDNSYNLQLITIVARSLGLPGAVREEPASPPVRPMIDRRSQRLAARLLARIRRWGYRVADPVTGALARLRRPDTLLCAAKLSWKSLLRIAVDSRLDVAPIFFAPLSGPAEAVLDDKRKALAALPYRNELEKTAIATLPYHLPTLYLEGYHAAAAAAYERFPRAPKVLLSAVAWSADEAFKFAAAQLSERGTRLAGYQQGGGFGMYRFYEFETLQVAMTDRYYAWGWANGNVRIHNLPCPGLAPAGFGRRDRDGSILFASNTAYRYTFELGGFPVCAQWLAHMDLQARFVNSLPASLRDRLIARLYWADFGWNQRERLQRNAAAVRLDDYDSPFLERLSRCDLFVADHAGTTMIEAIALDVPTILFWGKKEGWEMRPCAQPYFDALEAAGIWHPTPEAAARVVEEAASDPRAWWNAPARRQASRAFAEHFGLARDDWTKVWINELESLGRS